MFKEIYNRDGTVIEISIDDGGRTLRIDGQRYSIEIFKMFSELAENGDILKFVKRENEKVYLEHVYPEGDNA